MCKVVDINMSNKTAKVLWYKGAKTTLWTPCKKTEGRVLIDWIEVVLCSDLYSHSFNLTSGGKLPGKVQEECDEYREVYM